MMASRGQINPKNQGRSHDPSCDYSSSSDGLVSSLVDLDGTCTVSYPCCAPCLMKRACRACLCPRARAKEKRNLRSMQTGDREGDYVTHKCTAKSKPGKSSTVVILPPFLLYSHERLSKQADIVIPLGVTTCCLRTTYILSYVSCAGLPAFTL